MKLTKVNIHLLRFFSTSLAFRKVSLLLSFCLFLFSKTAFAQLQPDTLYSYDQLQEFLDDAKNNKDIWRLAEVYGQFGDYYFHTADHENTFKNYTRSIGLYNDLGNPLKLNQVKIALGDYYNRLDNLKEASKLYENAIAYYKEDKKLPELARAYLKISAIKRKEGNYKKESDYLNKCLEINEIVKDTLLEVVFNIDKAINQQNLQQYDDAIETAKHALDLSYGIKNFNYISMSLLRLGVIYQLQGKHQLAIQYFMDSQLITPPRFSERFRTIYKHLSESHSAKEEHEAAYSFLKKYSILNDSILNADKLEVANRLSKQYENKQKDILIQELEMAKRSSEGMAQQQRRLLYSFVAAFLIFLPALYLIIRFYQQKIHAKEVIVKQKEEIKRQKITELENNIKIESMHSMIAGQEAERERVAKDLHDSLGGLLSTVKLHFNSLESKLKGVEKIQQYQNANNLLDEACQEVRDISRNLQPSSLVNMGLVAAIKDLINRVNDPDQVQIDFQYYGMEEKLENTIALTIYRIVQELFHNSLKHAQAKEILIQLTRENGELIIMVEDDGIGFDVEGVKKGMGSENILSRVNYLKGDFSVHSVKEQGTTTMINVPV